MVRICRIDVLLVTVLIAAAGSLGQNTPASARETFEQMLSEPASVRLAKLLRQATTVVIGNVGWRGIVADPDGSQTREYDVLVIECLENGEVCPVAKANDPAKLRVRPDADALAFTAPELRVNQHYILFLCRLADSTYYVTCGNQGIFRVVRPVGDWDWNYGYYARTEDEIEVLSAVPSFGAYNQMSFWEFSQELSYLPHLEIPLTRLNVDLLLATYMSPSHVARIIEERKVNFDLTAEVEAQLRKQGADREILGAIARSRATQ